MDSLPISHRQEHDLFGLSLQPEKDNLRGKDEYTAIEVTSDTSYDGDKSLSHACPIHQILLAELRSDTYSKLGQDRIPADLPMERYLAEGPAERYALFRMDVLNSGEDWARYTKCLCVCLSDVDTSYV